MDETETVDGRGYYSRRRADSVALAAHLSTQHPGVVATLNSPTLEELEAAHTREHPEDWSADILFN